MTHSKRKIYFDNNIILEMHKKKKTTVMAAHYMQNEKNDSKLKKNPTYSTEDNLPSSYVLKH